MNGTLFPLAVVLAALACGSQVSCVRRAVPPWERDKPATLTDTGFGRPDGAAPARINGLGKVKMANDEGEMDLVARLFLTGPRGQRDVREKTVSYPWVSEGRVYWVLDRKRNRRVVVAALSGWEAPVCLSCVENTVAIADFLSRQFNGKFPGSERITEIAKFLKDVKVAPAASIASAELLDREKSDGFAPWLGGREKDPSAFVALCTSVKEHDNGTEWGIEFNVFNQLGGVDFVKASGTVLPFTLQQVGVTEMKPPGEFSYPIIGN